MGQVPKKIIYAQSGAKIKVNVNGTETFVDENTLNTYAGEIADKMVANKELRPDEKTVFLNEVYNKYKNNAKVGTYKYTTAGDNNISDFQYEGPEGIANEDLGLTAEGTSAKRSRFTRSLTPHLNPALGGPNVGNMMSRLNHEMGLKLGSFEKQYSTAEQAKKDAANSAITAAAEEQNKLVKEDELRRSTLPGALDPFNKFYGTTPDKYQKALSEMKPEEKQALLQKHIGNILVNRGNYTALQGKGDDWVNSYLDPEGKFMNTPENTRKFYSDVYGDEGIGVYDYLFPKPVVEGTPAVAGTPVKPGASSIEDRTVVNDQGETIVIGNPTTTPISKKPTKGKLATQEEAPAEVATIGEAWEHPEELSEADKSELNSLYLDLASLGSQITGSVLAVPTGGISLIAGQATGALTGLASTGLMYDANQHRGMSTARNVGQTAVSAAGDIVGLIPGASEWIRGLKIAGKLGTLAKAAKTAGLMTAAPTVWKIITEVANGDKHLSDLTVTDLKLLTHGARLLSSGVSIGKTNAATRVEEAVEGTVLPKVKVFNPTLKQSGEASIIKTGNTWKVQTAPEGFPQTKPEDWMAVSSKPILGSFGASRIPGTVKVTTANLPSGRTINPATGEEEGLVQSFARRAIGVKGRAEAMTGPKGAFKYEKSTQAAPAETPKPATSTTETTKTSPMEKAGKAVSSATKKVKGLFSKRAPKAEAEVTKPTTKTETTTSTKTEAAKPTTKTTEKPKTEITKPKTKSTKAKIASAKPKAEKKQEGGVLKGFYGLKFNQLKPEETQYNLNSLSGVDDILKLKETSFKPNWSLTKPMGGINYTQKPITGTFDATKPSPSIFHLVPNPNVARKGGTEGLVPTLGQKTNFSKLLPSKDQALNIMDFGNLLNINRTIRNQDVKPTAPILEQVQETSIPVMGDTMLKQGFYNKASNLRNQGQMNLTSDATKNANIRRSFEGQANQLEAQGDTAFAQSVAQSQQANLQNVMRNAGMRNQTANQNIMNMTDAANKFRENKNEQDAKIAGNISNFITGKVGQARVDQKAKEDLTNKFRVGSFTDQFQSRPEVAPFYRDYNEALSKVGWDSTKLPMEMQNQMGKLKEVHDTMLSKQLYGLDKSFGNFDWTELQGLKFKKGGSFSNIKTKYDKELIEEQNKENKENTNLYNHWLAQTNKSTVHRATQKMAKRNHSKHKN